MIRVKCYHKSGINGRWKQIRAYPVYQPVLKYSEISKDNLIIKYVDFNKNPNSLMLFNQENLRMQVVLDIDELNIHKEYTIEELKTDFDRVSALFNNEYMKDILEALP